VSRVLQKEHSRNQPHEVVSEDLGSPIRCACVKLIRNRIPKTLKIELRYSSNCGVGPRLAHEQHTHKQMQIDYKVFEN
jgi:hypothetical protein